MMMAGADDAARTPQIPASRLVAEALVEGHEAPRIAARAQQMGLCQDLTRAVVAACCGDQDVVLDVSSRSPLRMVVSAD